MHFFPPPPPKHTTPSMASSALKAIASAAAFIASASAPSLALASASPSPSSPRHQKLYPSYHLSPSAPPSSATRLQAATPFLSLCGRTVNANSTMSPSQPSVHEPPPETTPLDERVALPDLMTEFMVDMKCEGCVSAVRDKLEKLEGVKRVDVDLGNQVVRVLGFTSLKTLNTALEQTGRRARLIGQGSPEEFLISAAVAEFKGPTIHGVVRFAQVTMELSRVEAAFSGLSEGPHGWSINEYGDLTRGAASTGHIFHPPIDISNGSSTGPLGDLGILIADGKGQAEYSGSKQMVKVAELIGRALVVYETEDKSVPGIAAAVIARSAGVGQNYKKLCTCDGTVIWESTNNDFVKS